MPMTGLDPSVHSSGSSAILRHFRPGNVKSCFKPVSGFSVNVMAVDSRLSNRTRSFVIRR